VERIRPPPELPTTPDHPGLVRSGLLPYGQTVFFWRRRYSAGRPLYVPVFFGRPTRGRPSSPCASGRRSRCRGSMGTNPPVGVRAGLVAFQVPPRPTRSRSPSRSGMTALASSFPCPKSPPRLCLCRSVRFSCFYFPLALPRPFVLFPVNQSRTGSPDVLSPFLRSAPRTTPGVLPGPVFFFFSPVEAVVSF